MRILGPPSVTVAHLSARLTLQADAHPRFLGEMFQPLWEAAESYTVDPVGMVAQAFKETGGGRYGGKVKPEHYNPCGLKIRHLDLYPGVTDGDNPLAHAMFPNWTTGCRAQAQHLRAYAGWPVHPENLVDPRYTLVIGRHRCESFEELGGKWAPSLTYGQEIVTLARRLLGA